MGMQRLSAKSLKGLARSRMEQRGLGFEAGAVGVVAEQRVADVGEVDSDLVGAAGFQPAGEQAGDRLAVEAVVFLQEFPMGYRVAAARAHGLLVARLRVAVERRIDRAARAIRHAPDEARYARASGPVRPWSANWADRRR